MTALDDHTRRAARRIVAECANIHAGEHVYIEDEKILGTVHIALGDNEMLGGANTSSLHWDMMVLRPTSEVDCRAVLIDGAWQL